jgi:hypothetical protein
MFFIETSVVGNPLKQIVIAISAFWSDFRVTLAAAAPPAPPTSEKFDVDK